MAPQVSDRVRFRIVGPDGRSRVQWEWDDETYRVGGVTPGEGGSQAFRNVRARGELVTWLTRRRQVYGRYVIVVTEADLGRPGWDGRQWARATVRHQEPVRRHRWAS